MPLVPIKLMRNGLTKNTLLNLKNETNDIDTDDYLESRINTNTRAKKLLAIEDASEMAKLYLQKTGVFETIMRDIKKETGKNFTFHCKKTNAMKVKKKSDIEYIMMEIKYNNTTGHYGMAKVNHKNKTARLYDSMAKNESDFKKPLKKVLANTYNLSVYNNTLQPTGGFVAVSYTHFRAHETTHDLVCRLLLEYKKYYFLNTFNHLSPISLLFK